MSKDDQKFNFWDWIGVFTSLLPIIILGLVNVIARDTDIPKWQLVSGACAAFFTISFYFVKLTQVSRSKILEKLSGLDKKCDLARSGLEEKIDRVRFHNQPWEKVDIDKYYSSISACITKAQEAGEFADLNFPISLMSFRKDNPEKPSEPKAKTYHELLVEIARKHGVGIRRLVTVPTESKLQWIENLPGKFAGTNYAMRLLPGRSSLNGAGLPSLNVQIIGKNHAFVVTQRAGRTAGDSCMYFRSNEVVSVLLGYYDEVWKAYEDLKLVEDGVTFDKLFESLRSELLERKKV